MDDNSNIIIPFLTEHFFYWTGFLFPTLSVFCGLGIYYGLNHNTPGKLPTISRAFIQFPENRLFAVCMCIESCILGAIFYIRHKLISKMYKRLSQKIKNTSNKYHQTSVPSLNSISDILAIIVCLSLAGLSLFTIEDIRIVHLLLARIFWVAFLFYFITSDIAARRVQFQIGFISGILPYFIALYIIFDAFLIIKSSPDNIDNAKNYFAANQYVIAFLLFFKVMLIGYDNPPHDLVSSSSQMKIKLA